MNLIEKYLGETKKNPKVPKKKTIMRKGIKLYWSNSLQKYVSIPQD